MSVGGIRMSQDGDDLIGSQDPCVMPLSQNMSGVQMSQISSNVGGVHMSQNLSGQGIFHMSQNQSGTQMSQNAGNIRYFTSNVGGTFEGSGNQFIQGGNGNHNFQGTPGFQGDGSDRNYQRTDKYQCFAGNNSNQVQRNGNHTFHGSRTPIFTQDLLSCHDLTKN